MPLGVFDDQAKDTLKQLLKTTRPFYHQSLDLVVACRKIPQPASDETAQIKEWNRLLEGVERTLAWGVGKKLSDKDLDAANESFKDQYEQVNAYIKKYHPQKAETSAWEKVAKKDRMPEGWIKKVKADVQTKMVDLKSIPTLKLSITLWPEIPIERGTGGWAYRSYAVDCAVQIETTATLDILLHRLIESKTILKNHGDHWKSLSLKHNPQFYLKFPSEKADFDSSFSEVLHIPAVAIRSKVTKFKTLHVIVDRESESRQISLRNGSKVTLPDRAGNGWQLLDDEVSIAVKLKGLSPAIVIWNTKNPFSDRLSHPSATTLIDDSVDSGSSLSQEQLDHDLVSDEYALNVDQLTSSDQTVSIKYKEGASGFHLPTWDNPSDTTLASSVVMPTPCPAETERNPGSSRHHDTYGSLHHSSQIQMPVPTVHGKTALGRIATSPQSLWGSPSHSANIPPNPAPSPASVPLSPSNASSSRIPANPSTQVAAIRTQEILPEGSISDSLVPKAPPGIRVDEIPTPTPPLGVDKKNPISKRKPAINVNPSLPSPIPSSPAPFDSYFSPGSPSMRMVESDSPATPSGLAQVARFFGFSQNSRLALPWLQPLRKISDFIDGRRRERALSSVDQSVTQPIVNRSSTEESERNIASGSQHGNRTPSMRDLSEPRKEKAVSQDEAEDAIDELLKLQIQELRKRTGQPPFLTTT